jgi:hypothetical protein
MSVDPKQQQQQPVDKSKIIGFRVTEDELQNILYIYPVMHDCYELGIIDHDTLTSFLRFCVQFWMGHYRMKQQFDMSQREIEEEKKKLAAIVAEKEAYERSTRHVIQQATKKLKNSENSSRGTSKKPISHYSNQKTGQSQSSSSHHRH